MLIDSGAADCANSCVQRELDNRLSTMLLAAELAPGQTVRVDVADGRLSFQVTSPAPAVSR